ncbi:hypothetical protein [Bartonella florencae]|uniref:hypothetical protein n=1 Tax=Bartonella florencae TaxID=928210 RepID=UPI0002EBF177|nr:hypothetical protein [Bartonella florencae]
MLTKSAIFMIVMGMYYGAKFGIILDVLLSTAIVVLYYSFMKRLIAYSKVTGQFNKAMKERR